jgi:hypothetical protein
VTREPDIRCVMALCAGHATAIGTTPGGVSYSLCDDHASGLARPGGWRVDPLLRDPLIASIVCVAFHGALTGEPAAILEQWIAGDETARGPLEDLAHQLEILDGRGAWEVEPRERVEEHGTAGNTHVWLPCRPKNAWTPETRAIAPEIDTGCGSARAGSSSTQP